MKAEDHQAHLPHMISLNRLRFGHDPLAGDELNARSSGRLERIDEMVAMLQTQGQIYPLLVVKNPAGSKKADGLYFVFGGNRRLAALQQIHGDDAQVMVPCRVFPPGTPAYELSLAENNALPFHPVERFRGYAELVRREKIKPADAAAEIERRFGLTTKEAAKSLALGDLADDVLDAWLAGTITADQARVFTLAASKADQARVLGSVLKANDYGRTPTEIRRRFLGRRKDAAATVKFAGVEAYRAAGGKLTEDLFGEKHVVHHPEIAASLARDELDRFCVALVESGWLWAARHDQMPKGWADYNSPFGELPEPRGGKVTDEEAATIERLQAAERDAAERNDDDAAFDASDEIEAIQSVVQARGYTPAQMKTAGVVVSVSDTGALKLKPGLVRPAEKAAAKAEAKKAAPKSKKTGPGKAAEIPSALAITLSEVLTVSAARVVDEHLGPVDVLRLVLAGFVSDGTYTSGPVRVSHAGMGAGSSYDRDDAEFGVELAKARKLNSADLAIKLAKIVASSIDLRNGSPTRTLIGDKLEVEDEGVSALLHFLPAKFLQAKLIAQFDPENYFDRAPGTYSRAALADMKVPVPIKGTKTALAEFAAEQATKYRWLPVQLRTKDYAGPKLAPAKAARNRKKRRL